MPRRDYKTCRVCGRHEREVGPISHGRLCAEHAAEHFAANISQLRDGSGPFYEHWARRSLMEMHRRLVAATRGQA